MEDNSGYFASMPPCKLCQRNCPKLTEHHLVPRQQTKRKKQEPGPTTDICAPCHKQIHVLFTNKELAPGAKYGGSVKSPSEDGEISGLDSKAGSLQEGTNVSLAY